MDITPAFRALGDPTRRAILDLLAEEERPVGVLVDRFSMSQPALSQHLRVLRNAGLVVPRKEGRRRLYRVEGAPLAGVYDWVGRYERFWNARLDALGAFLDGEASR